MLSEASFAWSKYVVMGRRCTLTAVSIDPMPAFIAMLGMRTSLLTAWQTSLSLASRLSRGTKSAKLSPERRVMYEAGKAPFKSCPILRSMRSPS